MGGVGWVVTWNKPGTEWERWLCYLPEKCVLLHELEAQITVFALIPCGSLLASQSQELLSNKQQQKTGATVVKIKFYSESL